MYPSYAAKWNICFNIRFRANRANSVFFQRYNCVHMWLCGSNMRSDIWTIWTNFGFVNICLFAIQDPTISKTILICCLDRNRSILNSCSWMWQKKNGQYWKSRDHQIRHQKILKSSSFFKYKASQRTLRHINYKICKFIQNMILPPINQCEKKTMSQLGIFVGIVQQSCNCTFTTLLKLQRSSFLFYYRAMQTMVVFLVDLCTVFLGI